MQYFFPFEVRKYALFSGFTDTRERRRIVDKTSIRSHREAADLLVEPKITAVARQAVSLSAMPIINSHT